MAMITVAYMLNGLLFFVTDVNECSNKPCKNGATCSDKVNDYTCVCAVGFTGHTCETGEHICYYITANRSLPCCLRPKGLKCTMHMVANTKIAVIENPSTIYLILIRYNETEKRTP